MLRQLIEMLAAMAGLIVLTPEEVDELSEGGESMSDQMIKRMQREVELSHAKVQTAFDDYEHRIRVLTEEVGRLKNL